MELALRGKRNAGLPFQQADEQAMYVRSGSALPEYMLAEPKGEKSLSPKPG